MLGGQDQSKCNCKVCNRLCRVQFLGCIVKIIRMSIAKEQINRSQFGLLCFEFHQINPKLLRSVCKIASLKNLTAEKTCHLTLRKRSLKSLEPTFGLPFCGINCL
jgi:hypothetical protein